jgi:hypothetical protein
MIADISSLIRSNQLTSFHEMHDVDDFAHALYTSQQPFSFRKVVLSLNPPDRLAEHDALPKEQYDVFDTTVV